MKYTLYIGIDPGSNTGVAFWYPAIKLLELKQFTSHCAAMLFIYNELLLVAPKDGFHSVKLRIEDARKAKARPDLAVINKGKLQGVGYVKAYSKDWEAFCKLNNYDYEMVAPINTKVNPVYFERLTGLKTFAMQSHLRDAGMLVFGK